VNLLKAKERKVSIIRKKLFFLICVVFCFTQFCISQDYRIEIINKEDGLSQSNIMCGLEDKHGFLWFGTINGLNRYDGKEFLVFKHISNDSSSISNNYISDIAEDEKGYIWLVTSQNGLDRLEPRTCKFKKYKLSDENTELSAHYTILPIRNYDGRLWLYRDKADDKTILLYYDEASDSFRKYQTGNNYIDSILSHSHFSVDFFVAKNGILIFQLLNTNKALKKSFGADLYEVEKIIILNTKKNSINLVELYKDYRNLRFIGADESGNPIVHLSSGTEPYKIMKFDLNDYSFKGTNFRIDKRWYDHAFSISLFYYNYKMFASSMVNNQNMFSKYSKYNGLFQFNDSNFLEFNLKAQIHSIIPESNKYNDIKKIFSHSNNIIWDYHDNGLIKIIPKFKRVNNYRNEKKDDNSISNNIIRAVHIDKENVLWVGTYNGLNKFDSQKNRWIHYFNNSSDKDFKKNIFNVIKDCDNNKLILGTNNGVFLFDKKTAHFTEYTKQDDLSKNLQTSRSNNIWGLLQNNNELWIGTLLGLFKNKFGTNIYKLYSHSPTDPNSISYEGISTIFKDKKNNIWIGTHNGLNRYLPEIDGFKVYKHNSNAPYSLCGNNVWSFCEDKTGNLWVSAYNAGINKYNPKTDNFTSITRAEGLPDEGIVSMVCDSNDNLWLGSMKGLIKFEQRTKKFTRFMELDGFQGDEYSYNAAAVTSENHIIIGGIGGLSIFSPNDLKINQNIPNIIISKLFFENSLVSYFMQDGDTIKTDWKTDFIKIQFSALDFVAPQLNQYSFKVLGLNKDWVYLGNQNSIILSGVEPGEYTLLIKASNNDGVWNQKGISLHLSIVPPYWLTSWFKIIMYSSAFFSLFAIVGYLYWRSHEKYIIRKKIDTLQLKALQAQMNPHFIFNSLNSILSLIVSDEKQKAVLYLTKFSKLLRSIVERSRASSISLDEEIKNTILFLEIEQFRFENRFSYSFQIDEKINLEETFIPTLFIQPYLENSIKHGQINQIENGMVEIIIKESGRDLLFYINDNGIGRKEAKPGNQKKDDSHKSYGMDISKERLAMFNSNVKVKDLYKENGSSAGTQIEIIIYNYKDL